MSNQVGWQTFWTAVGALAAVAAVAVAAAAIWYSPNQHNSNAIAAVESAAAPAPVATSVSDDKAVAVPPQPAGLEDQRSAAPASLSEAQFAGQWRLRARLPAAGSCVDKYTLTFRDEMVSVTYEDWIVNITSTPSFYRIRGNKLVIERGDIVELNGGVLTFRQHNSAPLCEFVRA